LAARTGVGAHPHLAFACLAPWAEIGTCCLGACLDLVACASSLGRFGVVGLVGTCSGEAFVAAFEAFAAALGVACPPLVAVQCSGMAVELAHMLVVRPRC